MYFYILVVQFKNATRLSRLEGCSVKGTTIKVYVRLLSKRSPIILGETKQMLDWTGFSTTLNDPQFIKVPIWNNNKITGHLSLSYTFSKTSNIENFKNDFLEKHMNKIIEIEDSPGKQSHESLKIPVAVETINKVKNEDNSKTMLLNQKEDEMYPKKDITRNQSPYGKWSKRKMTTTTKEKQIQTNYISTFHTEDQIYLYNKMYPERDECIIENQLLLKEWPKKEIIKITKGVQTNFDVRQFNKSIQTHIKTSNVATQVVSEELLEDSSDKTICCDVQNIFRCTHEYTFNIEKKYDSTFNYVTYQFPECITNNTGKGKTIIIKYLT